MVEPHIDEKELGEKIISLFEYRLFPQLLDQSEKDSEIKTAFQENLIDLQASIYFLDAHLEAHWTTDKKVLDWHWQNMVKHLSAFGVSPAMSPMYLNHIRKYEKHELELRAGKSPVRLDMEYFYFYKSCDVKLLRRLIYEKYPLLSATWGKLSDWRYYDLVTEVNDDVEDLYEDLQYINGNRFLISLLYQGKETTKKQFADFLNVVKAKATQKTKDTKSKKQQRVTELTLQRVDETLKLLDDRVDNITDSDLKSSRLMNVQSEFSDQLSGEVKKGI